MKQKGASGEEAYELVRRNAMKAWKGGGDFLALLKADKDVTGHMSAKEIETCFGLDHHLRHLDTIFKRVFG